MVIMQSGMFLISSSIIYLYRMLIQYGLMRGLIRHLQKYPVLVGPEATEDSSSDSLQPYLKYAQREA